MNKDQKGYLVMAVAAVFLGGLGMLTVSLEKASEIDPVTLCSLKNPPLRQTIILVDKSDRWDDDDIARISKNIAETSLEVPTQSRLTVVAIAGKEGDQKSDRPETKVSRLFDKCNPGREEECNALYQTCSEIKRRYEKSFGIQMSDIAAILSSPGTSSFSPLFETLVQTVDDSLDADLDIHFVSDLMENGKVFRFYDVIPLAEELYAEYPIEFDRNIAISIHFVERHRHSRELREAVKAVWAGYFELAGVEYKFERLLITD